MSWMSPADFEALYQAYPDPWNYIHSDYEHQKYAATLAACGPGPFRCGLELGSSIGVFSAMLAPRCQRLVTVDAARTGVERARSRLESYPGVELVRGEIPEAVPALSYDLVVTSEVLYYLAPARLADTVELLAVRMRPGARLVAVHWRPSGPDRPFDAAGAHAVLRTHPQLRVLETDGTADYLLDVLERK